MVLPGVQFPMKVRDAQPVTFVFKIHELKKINFAGFYGTKFKYYSAGDVAPPR